MILSPLQWGSIFQISFSHLYIHRDRYIYIHTWYVSSTRYIHKRYIHSHRNLLSTVETLEPMSPINTYQSNLPKINSFLVQQQQRLRNLQKTTYSNGRDGGLVSWMGILPWESGPNACCQLLLVSLGGTDSYNLIFLRYLKYMQYINE